MRILLCALVLLAACSTTDQPVKKRIPLDRPVPESPHDAAWGKWSVPR